MWFVLAGIIASSVFATMYMADKWSNPFSQANIHTTTATNVAENIIGYATTVKQYAQYKNAFDVSITTAQLTNFSTYQLRLLGDYRATVISYGQDKYEIVSWDTISDTKATPAMILSKLSDSLNLHRSIDGNTNYTPLVIINDSCSATIVNSYVGNIYKNVAGQQNLFKTICQSYIPSGFKVGKYNLLIQVFL